MARPGQARPGQAITYNSVSNKVSGVEPEGKEMTTLLEEMIVSWQCDSTDMSPRPRDREASKAMDIDFWTIAVGKTLELFCYF